MEKDRHREQYRQHDLHRTAAQTSGGYGFCPRCGAAVAAGARYCEECGETLADTAVCTFCGAETGAGDAFCPECGNPRSGITCPECGTLNFRSFCRTCNRPLNAMALYAVEQAKADPRYRRAARLAEEIADIEDELARLQAIVAQERGGTEPLLQVDESVSDETRRLLDEYERLSREASPLRTRPGTPPAPVKAEEFTIEADSHAASDIEITGPRGGISDAEKRLAELQATYEQKVAEFQSEVEQMIPDPADPPEIQRNYVCAHMITFRATAYTTRKQRVGWVCNKCHVLHNNPSECCVAEFGGQWLTKDVRIAIEVTRTDSINI